MGDRFRAEIQMLDLAHCGRKLFHNTLVLPQDYLITAMAVFSPGLELVLICRYVFQTKLPQAEVSMLPLPMLRNTGDFEVELSYQRCEFSPCAGYFAAVENTMLDNKCPILLHVLKLDLRMGSYIACNTARVALDMYTALEFSFHPVRPELLVCG
jgi:hypothetical protein